MTIIDRSSRPTCPACGFAVFNRRCATCEKCHAALPASIAYTPTELVTLRQEDKVDDEARAKRIARARAERARRGLGAGFVDIGASDAASRTGTALDAIDLGIDLSDLLAGGGD